MSKIAKQGWLWISKRAALGVSAREVRALLFALFACSWLVTPSAHALERVAMRSGNWNSTATWGGAVPVSGQDNVTIPAGITVTVSAGTEAILFYEPGRMSGTVDLSGTLIIAGTAKFYYLKGAESGAVVNNSTGRLELYRFYINHGSMLNRGTIVSMCELHYDYGQLTNDLGGVLDNRGMMTFSDTTTVTNRGTISNNYQLEIYSPLDNYGSITNGAGRIMGVYRNLRNLAGAKITNFDLVNVHGSVTLRNDGTIVNSGSQFQNNGKLINSCSGVVTGNALVGNAPIMECTGGVQSPTVPTTPAPAGAWQKLNAPTSWASISAGSASKLVGTSAPGADGNGYMLSASSTTATYYTQPNNASALAMAQTSIGADGTWWGVKADQSIWRLTSTGWSTVPGTLKQVSVGNANNVWGVNSANAVYQWNGYAWTRITGELVQVSVASDGSVWGITAASKIVKWTGSAWSAMPGEATRVAVGSANNVWVLNAAGTVYKWNGSGWDTVSEAGSCDGIAAAADGTVLVIRRADGAVYRKP